MYPAVPISPPTQLVATLRGRRAHCGLTQKQAGVKVGLLPKTISMLESFDPGGVSKLQSVQVAVCSGRRAYDPIETSRFETGSGRSGVVGRRAARR